MKEMIRKISKGGKASEFIFIFGLRKSKKSSGACVSDKRCQIPKYEVVFIYWPPVSRIGLGLSHSPIN